MKNFTVKDKLSLRVTDIQYLLEDFLMMFEEKVMRRCGVCSLPSPQHKMDCHREYTKSVNQRG